MTSEQQVALRTARSLADIGHSIESILASGLIPEAQRKFVRDELERDANIVLVPARAVVADPNKSDWLLSLDRSSWYYWPALRSYLITTKGWQPTTIRSLDDSSDRILRQLAPPSTAAFDVRGLVLGFVQSGKTANFTALIAKAVDAGYRLIVVLSGIDNGLRRQTNIRLKRELVGYPDGRSSAVHLPPLGRQWHEFTRDDLGGDFQPGFANHAALQGTQPVLLVVKKNGPVLRRLLRWLDDSPSEVRRTLPILVIDDEADQASVDTRGTYQTEDGPPDPDYEPPSVINGLIRDLLSKFDRRAYVAYTATPFANVLIPHDTNDPQVGNDLYPKDFIIDLPKPSGYFGSEEIFGRMDAASGEQIGGLDIIRDVPDTDVASLEHGQLPSSLDRALEAFVLAGAGRAQRGDASEPATMLIHTSQLIAVQTQMRSQVDTKFAELRDEWRYQRNHGIRERLTKRWDEEFRPLTAAIHPTRDASFEDIESHIGPFLEAVQVREVNSATGDVLDYEREPNLKAIAVGGNRLSRGLTLEGLLVSYFVRRSATYDTLMQMGRWFGYRIGFEDLTRIWTTAELSGWFSDLALVEHRLREDIAVYENQGLTPYQVGMRIWQHPAMQVTSPLKRRFSSSTTIAQSYALNLEQTFKFPLRRLDDLAVQCEANRLAVMSFLRQLGDPSKDLSDAKGPVWAGVVSRRVLGFLSEFRLDDETRTLSIPLISTYIERLSENGELIRWTIAVRGRASQDNVLGSVDWGVKGDVIAQVSRSRLGESDSLGVITDPDDEAIGLGDHELQEMQRLIASGTSRGRAARHARSPEEGLLIIYPISRRSGVGASEGGNRKPIYSNPDDPKARDIIGFAISFPRSNRQQRVEAYLEGTVGWRPVE